MPGNSVNIAMVDFKIHDNVDSSACLPIPDHYMFPTTGQLATDMTHLMTSIKFKRSCYIYGPPGVGKDACVHAFSGITKTPSLVKQIRPGVDIESWFFTRSLNASGTTWETGALMDALVNGYTTPDGQRVPYLILLTDLDRATRSQAEHLRLVLDSISGRIEGPQGKVYDVLKGTTIVATGNTSGGGDDRGRMISANPIDASLMDRFERKFRFDYMSWADEQKILINKFPSLANDTSVLLALSRTTTSLRDSVKNRTLHGEFTHRSICAILSHAFDLKESTKSKKNIKDLICMSMRVWLDGLPDEVNITAAKRLIDPHFPMAW